MEAKPQNRQIIHTTGQDPGVAKGPNGNGHSVILEYKNGQRRMSEESGRRFRARESAIDKRHIRIHEGVQKERRILTD